MPEEVRCLAPSGFCEVIAEVCGVGKNEYYLGVSKMFFRMGAAAFLEELQADTAPSPQPSPNPNPRSRSTLTLTRAQALTRT